MTRNKATILIIVAVAATVLMALLRLMIDRPPGGSLGLAWPEARYAQFRVAALLGSLSVGCALAVSGVLLQALLRNPLASPFVLGLSSGAGLGVALAMFISYHVGVALSTFGIVGPAVLGSLVTLLIVFMLGRRDGWLDPLSLILAGIVISAIAGALTLFLQQLAPPAIHAEMARWMFGNIPQNPPLSLLVTVIIVSIIGTVLAYTCGRALDGTMLGDDEARSIGVAIGRIRLLAFTIAGVLAAAAVALAGPIAFVGIIAPHAARMFVGPLHRTLIIMAALIGMIILVGADILSQAIYVQSAGRVPVGIFTALLGGPAFIWLLRTRRVWGTTFK